MEYEIPKRLKMDMYGRIACEECGKWGYIEERRNSITPDGRWLCPRCWFQVVKGRPLWQKVK